MSSFNLWCSSLNICISQILHPRLFLENHWRGQGKMKVLIQTLRFLWLFQPKKKITVYFFSKSFVSSKSLYMFGNINLTPSKRTAERERERERLISQSRKRHLRMLVKEEEKVKDKIHCKWKWQFGFALQYPSTILEAADIP